MHFAAEEVLAGAKVQGQRIGAGSGADLGSGQRFLSVLGSISTRVDGEVVGDASVGVVDGDGDLGVGCDGEREISEGRAEKKTSSRTYSDTGHVLHVLTRESRSVSGPGS